MTSARDEVRAELLGRLGEVSGGLVRSIVTQIPAYATLTAPQLAEVTAIAEWGLARVLELWAGGGELTAADVQRFRGIGAARALDGRPLPGVLRAYRLAGSEIFDLVEQTGRSRLDIGDVLALSRLWMATIDTLSEALYAGHVAAAERATGDRTLAVGDLLDDLLLGRQVTRTGLADRLRELGLALGPRTSLLVVRAHAAGAEVSAAALGALLAECLDDPDTSSMASVHPDHGVAVVPSGTTVGAGALESRRWRGCLLADLRVADLPRAARLARHALAHAPDRAYARRALLEEPDAQLLALLGGHRDADPERLGRLPGDLSGATGDHLVVGLEAYLETGSAAAAASLLGVHPQTMRYRLGRIEELTGRDPRDGWDHLVLEAATLAARQTSVVPT